MDGFQVERQATLVTGVLSSRRLAWAPTRGDSRVPSEGKKRARPLEAEAQNLHYVALVHPSDPSKSQVQLRFKQWGESPFPDER